MDCKKVVAVVLLTALVAVVQSHGGHDHHPHHGHDHEHHHHHHDDTAGDQNEVISDKQIVRAVVESCGGCQLNRLPEIRSFIYDDVPLFHNVEFDRKHGAPSNLFLLNKSGQRVETINLHELTRQQCNEALLQRGFYKKSSVDEVVPEEYQSGPYNAHTEL